MNGGTIMTQLILEANELQGFVESNLGTTTVKVFLGNGQIILEPNKEAKERKHACDWVGIFKNSDGRSIVDEAIALRRSHPRN
jgi:hypothetical protein